MKKMISLLLCILLLAAAAVSVQADNVPKLTIRAGNSAPRLGDTVDFTVTIDPIERCRSGGIVLNYDGNVFEFVSGQCLVSNAFMSDFTDGTGVFAFVEEQALSGDVFRFTLRVKDAAAYGNYTVSCKTNFRNDSGSVTLQVSGAGIALNCEHTYGSWANADAEAHQRECSKCGQQEMSRHTWDDGRVTKQPTCKEEGQALLTCTVCGATKTKTLEKTDSHTYGGCEKVNDSTHKRSCTVCGKEETTDHTWDSGKVTKEPTCKDSGVKTYTCTGCGAVRTETIAKTQTHSYGTCVSASATTHKQTCTVCGKENTASHTWDGGKVTKEPTCKDSGVKTYTCTGCGAVRTETLAKTADHAFDNACDTSCGVCGLTRKTTHQYQSAWSYDRDTHYHVCVVCGDQADIDTHTPGKEATESTPQRCTVCGYVIKAALGHKHSFSEELSYDENGHWYPCSGCNVQELAEHDFENGCDARCETCGYVREVSHTYDAWQHDADGHWQVCAICGEMTQSAAHIPGAEATEHAAQTCTVCGYELAPKLEPVAVPEEETQTEAERVEEAEEPQTIRWWIVIVLLTVAAGAVAGAAVLLKRRKP